MVCLIFAKDFGNALEQLDNSLQSEDFKTACRLAHTVKGLAPNIGAEKLHQIAKAFELELHEGKTTHRTDFEHALTQVLAAIATLSEPRATVQAFAEPLVIGSTTVLSRLRELEAMLIKKQGKARKAAKEIESLLNNSTLHSAFNHIAAKIDKLKFDDALDDLQQLMQQHFSNAK